MGWIISNTSDDILIANWPVKGMYQPDAIASFTVGGATYLVTANEGDARDYAGLAEEERIKDSSYPLDSTIFYGFGSFLKDQDNAGRLKTTNTLGDTDNDGDFDEIYNFGARSFSIWDENGVLVYDSGDDLEQITASDPVISTIFNASNSNVTLKNRSDDKGPEPEGVTTGVINDTTYAFITLERVGGIIVYDVSDVNNPLFVQYINNRDVATATGDLAPEGIIFVSDDDSPIDTALVIVSNEESGTVTIYKVNHAFLPPSVDIVDASVIVDETSTTANVSFQLTNSNGTPSTIKLVAFDESTADASDYTMPIALTFPGNVDTIMDFTITITDDMISEATEYIAISVKDSANVSVSGDAIASVYIKDNEFTAPVANNSIELEPIYTYTVPGGSAEISAYDPAAEKLFVGNSTSNTIEVLDVSNPNSGVLLQSIPLSAYGNLNSVDVWGDTIVLAMENGTDPQLNGTVVFLDATGALLNQVTVGPMPDMVTFTPDHTKVLSANEGEPDDNYTNDPEGSVSVIDISSGVANATVTNATFTSF